MSTQVVLVQGFNRYEAADITGIPYDRFTYLDKIGAVKPVGKYGRLVLYSFDQMLKAMVTEAYKNLFPEEDMKWILGVLNGQMLEEYQNKEMIYFKLISKEDSNMKFILVTLDNELSFKELTQNLIAQIEFSEDEDPDDFFVEIHILKSVRYFIKKMLRNAEKSIRVTPEDFLARANLKAFTYSTDA